MINYQTIIDVILKLYGVDIRTKNRKRLIVDCRFVYYKLCKVLIVGFKLNKRCKEVVGWDHSTVIHGLKEFDLHYGKPYFKANGLYEDCLKELVNNPMGVFENLEVEYELIN